MKKRMIRLLLTLALVVGICPAAFASEANPIDDSAIYLGTWEVPDPKDDGIAPQYNEIPYTTVLESKSASTYTVPQGQPSGGYRFHNFGGSIYINTSGGSKVKFDVAVNWEIAKTVTISLTTGLASTDSSVGGLSVNIPADGNYYSVKLKHNYTVERIRVDTYQYNQLIDSFETTRTKLKSIDVYAVKVQ